MEAPDPPTRPCPSARLAAFAMLLLAAGCNPAAPKGQVIAVVNGQEITLAELNEEARARSIVGANEPAVRGALLQDLIDRKLLAQQAIEGKLDRTQQHLIARQRMEEVLLAQQLLAAVGNGSRPATGAELQQLIAASPLAFERRTILSVDQISFPRPSDPALIAKLQTAATLAQIDALLMEAALPRERLVKTWDSAVIPEATIGRLIALKPGKPFLLPHGNLLIAGEVLSATPQPLDAAQRLRLANEKLLEERRNGSMRQMLDRFRAEARVRYQSGFGPPPEPPAGK
jgi:EpsD family peptidyl-prolyl cis-trans isomerase